MDCAQHPGTGASTLCTRCDQLMCTSCINERNGRNFCGGCAEFLDRRSAQNPGPNGRALAPAVAAAASPPPPSPPAGLGFQSGAGATGDLYQGPQPSMDAGLAPPASAPGSMPDSNPTPSAPQGEVYQGDVYQGDTYQGDVYQGGVYSGDASDPGPAGPSAVAEGDVYQGDVYQGPPKPAPASDAPVSIRLTEEGKASGSTFKAILWGSVMGLFSAGAWYGAVVLTGYHFKFLAVVIGWLVGAATTAGAGRGGAQVGVLSLLIAGGAMLGGDYLINDHYYRQLVIDETMEADAFYDGDISDADIALYYDISLDELRRDLSGSELEEHRRYIEEEMRSGLDDTDEPMPAHLPFSQLFLWMQWWELVFIGGGAVQAFRVPMSDDIG
ncbi:MAG: hypothetical protein AAF657_34715 [Acidobacteriota bacterium]